ncbi:D-lactate dehydrogenase [Penicillium sp. IBT 35674x]|nr:D-lactate dehydrogenase [Penicillium sp. IBT 35674x]
MASTKLPLRYRDPVYQETHQSVFQGSLTKPLKELLPPGVCREDFKLAIEEFVSALGSDGVVVGEALSDYVDPYELYEDKDSERKVASAAVLPQSVEELQSVLKIANKYVIPLWTFSRGKNLGYGGPAPRLSGSVAVDLHRMNRIIEVNDKYSYAVVEPGVTFTDLYNYCVENKLSVWPSVPSLGWGSVVGNTLDRGTGFTPTATHHQNIAGLEAVLADGDVIRTGQFAISNSKSAHLSKFSFGPSIEGLFLQSNLGITTKMGIWLYPQPSAYASCTLDVPNLEDVVHIVDLFNELRQNGVVPNTVYVSSLSEFIAMSGTREKYWPREGPIPLWRLQELQKELNLGFWNAKFGLYGPLEVVQGHVKAVERSVAEGIPMGRFRSQVFSGKNGEPLQAEMVPPEEGGFFVGVPSLWSLPMVKYRTPENGKGIGGHIDYSPIIPSSGKAVLEWARISQKICEENGFDLFCDFFMHERHIIFVNFMTFDKTNLSHRDSMKNIFRRLFKEAKSRGYSAYRSHVNFMDAVADFYDFNNHAYRRFVEQLKDTVDRQSILSPGKQGIWGQRFRQNNNKAKGLL